MKYTYKSPVAALVGRAEALGWNCYVDPKDSSIEFSQDIPTGETFSFCINGDTAEEIAENICKYATGFDVEAHVKMWLDAKANGTSNIPPVENLIANAKTFQKMLDKLAHGVEMQSFNEITLRDKVNKAKFEFLEHCSDFPEYMPKEDDIAAVEDFYTCRRGYLPGVEKNS